MSALLFLGFALVVSAVGIGVLLVRNRKPRSIEAGMEQFQRGLKALAPEAEKNGGGRPG